MRSVLPLIFLVAGVALLVSGIAASESLQSTLTKFFNGVPSERAQWLLLGGVLSMVLGAILYVRSSPE